MARRTPPPSASRTVPLPICRCAENGKDLPHSVTVTLTVAWRPGATKLNGVPER